VTKVFVVGLDGAEFTLVERWMKEGQLPNLRRLSEEGAWGCLRSTTPPITPAAWTAFLTGKNPGKTGIYDFYQVNRSGYALYYPNASHNRAETIQEILSEAGFRVGLVNVPMTYPPTPVNGYVIPGLGAPDNASEDFAYPPGFLKNVERETGIRYRILAEPASGKQAQDELVEAGRRLFQERRTLIGHLLRKHPTDFFAVVISETDVLAHYFWKYMDPGHPQYTEEGAALYGRTILGVYQQADRLIGEWMSSSDPDTHFFVISDHGMGPFYYAPDYLDYLGYRGWFRLRMGGRASSARMLPVLAVLYGLWRFGRRLYENGKQVLPWRIRNALNSLFPRAKRALSTNFSLLDLVDWDKTSVYFCDPRNIGYLFINLKGREPKGIVSPEEYDALTEALIADLKAMRVPGVDVPLVDEVHRGRDLYSGPYVDEMPDLVIVWNYDATKWAKEAQKAEWPEVTRRLLKPLSIIPMASKITTPFSGFHTMRGIFFARGPGIRSGYHADNLSIYDLMPTFLGLFGVEVPQDVDGRVLAEIFQPEMAAKIKPKYRDPRRRASAPGSPYSPAEQEAIQKRLRDLGYID